MKKVFRVSGMACKHCAAKVTAKASSLAGVKTAIVALGEGLLTVEYDDTLVAPKDIAAAVSAAGFPCEEA